MPDFLPNIEGDLGRFTESKPVLIVNPDGTLSIGSGPAPDGYQVTPSDTVDLPQPIRGLRVGAAGDVRFVSLTGQERVFPAAQVGERIEVGMTRILATGTTAANLFGFV
ncbi:spike base protein, RCAP_Rcc01079 family [Profundibacterium mesophilum]|uniref:Uncharacterized protein n=1 Tax=Profundibacterium mesophilum KAUST100406-0324 TaxID=1037889 RepID=A0A921NP57_9RHOB|nr:hypothetical protein [Profundibacterium mesophilum]KAF0675082.1 hypothetical protein PMES_02603 [Profundibacterium mesophilum KAUST100406-0324]